MFTRNSVMNSKSGKVLHNKSSAEAHEIKLKTSKNHECSVCRKMFSRKDSLYQHSRTFHKEIIDHLPVPARIPRKQKKALSDKNPTTVISTDHADLIEFLPNDTAYEVLKYSSTENGFIAKIKIQMSDMSEVPSFIAQLQGKAKIRFRLTHVDKNEDGVIKRKRYVCHHNSQKKSQNNRKDLSCPASLGIIIKESTQFNCILRINNCHNHKTFNSAAVQLLKPNQETIEKFEKMFQAGYTPSKAFKRNKEDLQLEYGDKYYLVVNDRSVCPDKKWVFYYYSKQLKKTYSANENIIGPQNISTDTVMLSSIEDNSVVQEEEQKAKNEKSQLIVETFKKLAQDFILRVTEKPDTFEAGMEAFNKQYQEMATDASLLSALHTFGKYNGVTSKRRYAGGSKIKVQPTAIARRKMACGGTRALQSGTPAKCTFTQEDGYVLHPNSNRLQPQFKKKQEAPNNLHQCVNNNV